MTQGADPLEMNLRRLRAACRGEAPDPVSSPPPGNTGFAQPAAERSRDEGIFESLLRRLGLRP
jgi:hypothetical protein